MIRVRTKLVFPWRRPMRPRRGSERLLADLETLHRLADAPRLSARARVEAAVGARLASELDRRLQAGGGPARKRRSGLRRAA